MTNELTVKTKSNYILSLESRMIYRKSKYIPKQNQKTDNLLIITSMESKVVNQLQLKVT